LKVFITCLIGLVAAWAAFAAPDEAALGRAQGYPVCKLGPSAFEERCLVGNLSCFDEIAPSHPVAKGPAVHALKRAAHEPKLLYRSERQVGTIDTFLAGNRDTGLLILRGDTILVERYQYERKSEMRFQSFSMAKTVVGMLFGIALAEGKIGSIDDRAEQYVPALKGHPYGETKLRHLLTMSSGVKFLEVYNGRDDVTELARRTLYQQGPGGVDALSPFNVRERPAGEKFSYASAETEVLSLVLRAAVGRPLAEYLSEKIWRPMGAEADATWLVDGGGNELGYMGLNATLRDWGRLGLLLANGGAMDGKQIIPAEWVKAATQPDAPHLRVGYATRNNGYGYQTWLVDEKGRFALFGVRGQAVFVDPHTKLVIVHTAVQSPTDRAARGEQFRLFYGVLESLEQQKDL
jgi:CubicO group peptidase (beta-lactamase class C family)